MVSHLDIKIDISNEIDGKKTIQQHINFTHVFHLNHPGKGEADRKQDSLGILQSND